MSPPRTKLVEFFFTEFPRFDMDAVSQKRPVKGSRRRFRPVVTRTQTVLGPKLFFVSVLVIFIKSLRPLQLLSKIVTKLLQ